MEDIYRIGGTIAIGSVFFVGLAWVAYGCRRAVGSRAEDLEMPVFYGVCNKWVEKWRGVGSEREDCGDAGAKID